MSDLTPGQMLSDDDAPDGWIILRVTRLEAHVVDLVNYTIWSWTWHDDGIRVRQAMTLPLSEHEETEWAHRAINRWPPPAEVAAHLRQNRRKGRVDAHSRL